MNRFFDHLPITSKQALMRWYTISCIALIVTFITLAVIHTKTIFELRTIPKVQAPYCELSVPADTTFDTIAQIRKAHRVVLETLQACIESFDPHIQLTKITVTHQAQATCTGIIASDQDLTSSIQALEYNHFDLESLHIQAPTFNITLTYKQPCKA